MFHFANDIFWVNIVEGTKKDVHSLLHAIKGYDTLSSRAKQAHVTAHHFAQKGGQ
jgi:hypothetical protein